VEHIPLIILKIPRSGSTWFTDVLNNLDGVFISKEIIQHADAGKFAPKEILEHLVTALEKPTDKLSSRRRWLPSLPFSSKYLWSGKFMSSMRIIGFTLNPEHCERAYIGSSGFNIGDLKKRIPRARVVLVVRRNLFKAAVSAETGRRLHQKCGFSNLQRGMLSRHPAAANCSALVLRQPLGWLPDTLAEKAMLYQTRQDALIATARRTGMPLLEVSYEELQSDLPGTVLGIAEWLGAGGIIDLNRAMSNLKSDVMKRSTDNLADSLHHFRLAEKTLQSERRKDCGCLLRQLTHVPSSGKPLLGCSDKLSCTNGQMRNWTCKCWPKQVDTEKSYTEDLYPFKLKREANISALPSTLGSRLLSWADNHNSTAPLPPPTTLPEIESAFGGRRAEIARTLARLCEEFSTDSGDPCRGITSPEFGSFLTAMQTLSRGSNVDGLTAASWEKHCQVQKALNDHRSPVVCPAAAFAYVPFSLSPTAVKRMDAQRLRLDDSLERRQQDKQRLVVVTVISKVRRKNPTLRSACFNGIPIHVLGVGIKDFYKRGLGYKVDLLLQFVSKISASEDESTVLMFVDGADVLFQSSPSTILRRFRATKARVLFSAEHACFPMKYWPWNLNLGRWSGGCSGACSNARFICENLYPTSPSPSSNAESGSHADRNNRWLNSGVFIGYLGAVRRILNAVRSIPKDLVVRWPGTDQGLYTHMLLARHWDIEIDRESRVFMSYGIVDDETEAYPGRLSTAQLLRPNGSGSTRVWRSSYDSSVPSVVHFNADGKRVIKEVTRHLYVRSPGEKERVKSHAACPIHYYNGVEIASLKAFPG
jgi:hypothetical protein